MREERVRMARMIRAASPEVDGKEFERWLDVAE